MNVVVRQDKHFINYEEADARLARDVVRLLRDGIQVNLAPHMYTGDADGGRHANGHSSPSYYVMSDEDATFAIAMREITARYENFLDMGVGGDEAVLRRGLIGARTVGAKVYAGFDSAPGLVHRAAHLANQHGLRGQAHVCDIFEQLPVKLPNSLVGVLGLTIGNVETFQNPLDLKKRLAGIYRNYADAVTNPNKKTQAGLLVGWDANMDVEGVKACYDNPEMAALIRSLLDRVMDTSKFDYHINAEKISLGNGEDVIFLTLGHRSRETHTIVCGGEKILILADQFVPVLNSDRVSVPFMADAFEQGGWLPQNRWSASGRVHYGHCNLII